MRSTRTCSLSIFSIIVISLLLHNSQSSAQVYSSGTANNTGQLHVTNVLNLTATSQLTNSGTINTGNNIISDGTSAYNGGTFNLNGTSPQVISGSTPLNSTNVIFNNAAGCTLNITLSIAGTANMTSGIVTAASQTSPLEFTAAGTHSGTSNISHVNGWTRKLGNGNFTYPVGNGTIYQKTDVNLSANANGMQVSYVAGDAGTGPYGTGGSSSTLMKERNQAEYWNITPVSTATGTVTIYWDNNNNASVAPVNARVVAHYTGGSWLNEGGNNLSGTTTNGAVTSNLLSSWSPFTLGATSSTPLALNLTSFKATVADCKAILTWTTTNEQNLSHFELERLAANGNSFTTVAVVAAKGKSLNEAYYTVTDDKAIQGQNIYRLKSVDADGSARYSASLNVLIQCNTRQLTIYPNPTTDAVYVKGLSGGEKLSVFNATGQLVISHTATIDETISLKNFAAGIYHLMITGDNGRSLSASIVKQ